MWIKEGKVHKLIQSAIRLAKKYYGARKIELSDGGVIGMINGITYVVAVDGKKLETPATLAFIGLSQMLEGPMR